MCEHCILKKADNFNFSLIKWTKLYAILFSTSIELTAKYKNGINHRKLHLKILCKKTASWILHPIRVRAVKRLSGEVRAKSCEFKLEQKRQVIQKIIGRVHFIPGGYVRVHTNSALMARKFTHDIRIYHIGCCWLFALVNNKQSTKRANKRI